jgi:hypothetical protein
MPNPLFPETSLDSSQSLAGPSREDRENSTYTTYKRNTTRIRRLCIRHVIYCCHVEVIQVHSHNAPILQIIDLNFKAESYCDQALPPKCLAVHIISAIYVSRLRARWGRKVMITDTELLKHSTHDKMSMFDFLSQEESGHWDDSWTFNSKAGSVQEGFVHILRDELC